MFVCYRLPVIIVALHETLILAVKSAGKRLYFHSAPRRIPANSVLDLSLDSWNFLLRARRKRMWRKQKREEATCTMSDVVANAAIGAIRDAAATIPHTDFVPPSQEEEDMATQDIAVALQAEAHFSDVSEASDKPTRVDVESTGVYSSEEEEEEGSESDFDEMTQLSPVQSLKRSSGFAARDIDFQDFLRYVESHLSFALSSAHTTRPPPTRFASQEEFDEEREETFLVFSTSKALVDLASLRAVDGSESPHANTLGFIPPSGLTKPSVKCYQMGDTCLSQSALTRPAEVPAWMASERTLERWTWLISRLCIANLSRSIAIWTHMWLPSLRI